MATSRSRKVLLKEGVTDPAFDKVVDTLIVRADDYYIYLDPEQNLWWNHEPDYEPEHGWDAYYELYGKLTWLEAKAHETFRPISVFGKALDAGKDGANPRRLYFMMRMLGDALFALFEPGDVGTARAQLRRARTFLRNRQTEIARAWILSTTGIGTLFAWLLAALVGGGVAATTHEWSVTLGGAELALETATRTLGFLPLLAAGCTGTVLAVFHRLNGDAVDPSGGKGLLVLEGLGRLAVGGIAGVAAVFAWRAGLLPALVTESAPPEAELLIAALFGMTGQLPQGLVKRLTPVEEQAAEEEEVEEEAEEETT